MKILSVSDSVATELIGDNSPLAPGSMDLILGCGDLPPEYLGRLQSRYDVPLFYVLGNHDIRHRGDPPGCTDITGRIVKYRGSSFLGLSGSRWYNGGPHQYHEWEMRAHLRRLWFKLWRLKQLDVLITHAPPRHVHDAEDPCHKGFRCYNRFIERYRPRFLVHGHIHAFFENPSERISRVGETQVINSFGYYLFTV